MNLSEICTGVVKLKENFIRQFLGYHLKSQEPGRIMSREGERRGIISSDQGLKHQCDLYDPEWFIEPNVIDRSQRGL